MPIFRSALIAVAIVVVNAPAQADPVTISTRFGDVKTDGNGELQFKGKVVSPVVSIVSSAYVLATFKLQTSDVVFISQAAGNTCPGQFVYVTVTPEGAKSTPVFGTCYDDNIKPVQVGESIAFAMKKLGGKGSVRYIYERGVMFEDGKPVK